MTSAMHSRPVRLLAAGTLINSLGSGLYLPLSLVLLSTLSGLSLAVVGGVLTGAMTVSLLLMPASGVLVDRWGPKRVLMAALGAQAFAFAGYPLAHGLVAFTVLAGLASVGGQAVKAAQPVLVSALADGPARSRLLALTRSLSNAGLGMGGLALACMPTGAGRGWWVGAAWLNAASFAATMLVYAGLPGRAWSGRGAGRPVLVRSRAWHNRVFRRYLAANTCSGIGYAALSNLVPLLAVVALRLPPALAGGLFTLNTVVTAVAGVPAIRWLQSRRVGDRPAATAGVLAMAAGMASFGAASFLHDLGLRAGVLVAGMTVYSLGEAVHSPTSTSLALDASPVAERGTYQGLYQMSWGVGAALAPATFTALVALGPVPAVLLPVAASLTAGALLHRTGSPAPTHVTGAAGGLSSPARVAA